MQADADENSVMQSSSKTESLADSDDDEDYEPEALSQQENRSCSASEAEGGEQSTSCGGACANSSEVWEGGQCEQSKVRLLPWQTHFAGQMRFVCQQQDML